MRNKKLIYLGVAAALGAGAVQADPVPLPEDAPLYFQFNNLEQVSASNSISVVGGAIDVNGDGIDDTPTSEGNWGVFNVSSLQNGGISQPNLDISGGSAFFADDGTGDAFGQGQVTGIFYGLTLTSGTTATGGWMDIWWSDPADDQVTTADLDGVIATGTLDSPLDRTSANTMPGFAGDATMTFLVRLAFASGIIDGDATTTLQSSVAPTTNGASGQADGFANVMDINNDGVIDLADGAWAPAFNGDWFYVDTDKDGVRGEAGETRDLRFSTFFNVNVADWFVPGTDIVGVRSNDPARVYTAAQVPEPFTLGLMGAGLLGIGFSRRRKA